MTNPDLQNLQNYLAHVKSKQVKQNKTVLNNDETETSGVLGGEAVLDNDPLRDSIVLIQITRDQNNSICTGALVGRRSILTAAHCASKVEEKNLKVVLMDRLSDKKELFDVLKIDIHPNYDGTTQSFSDIAVLTLNRAVSQERTQLSLIKDFESINSDEVTLAGYGVTDESLSDAMILRKVKKSFKNELSIREKIIGVGQKLESGGFCRGDSGAPIIVRVNNELKVAGINSFTVELEKGKECHSASVAISIPQNINWINKLIN